MKTNSCHCQFVLMLLNIHFFLGPLLIGIPSHWLFASRSRFSPSSVVCWARHPPIVADHHETPVVKGCLHPLLDISPKNWRAHPPLVLTMSTYRGMARLSVCVTKPRGCVKKRAVSETDEDAGQHWAVDWLGREQTTPDSRVTHTADLDRDTSYNWHRSTIDTATSLLATVLLLLLLLLSSPPQPKRTMPGKCPIKVQNFTSVGSSVCEISVPLNDSIFLLIMDSLGRGGGYCHVTHIFRKLSSSWC